MASPSTNVNRNPRLVHADGGECKEPYPQSLEGLVAPVRRGSAILELGSGAEVLLGLGELLDVVELF